MKKADASPEEWAAYCALHRGYYAKNRDKIREKQRAYYSRPDVKARRKKAAETPEARERRRAKYGTPEEKALRKAQYARLRADPVKWGNKLANNRKLRTGMSAADVEQLRAIQNDRCAICTRPFDGDPQHMRADHCHDSGSPRGLLCHHCNIIEGMLRSMKLTPEEFAAKVSAYLKHPPILSLKRRG